MYRMRFDDDVPDGTTLEQLRGMEGQRMKALYRILAQQHDIGRFRRNYHPTQWDQQDPVNLALSSANTRLYGIVHAALLALDCSPALGFVHTGTQHAFVYDLADLYKAHAFSELGKRRVPLHVRPPCQLAELRPTASL